MSLTNQEEISFPELNQVVTINIGETLVSKGIRTTGKALRISRSTTFGKKPVVGSLLTCAFTVSPSSRFYSGSWQTKEETADCYGQFSMRLTTWDGGSNFNCHGNYVTPKDICHNPKTGEFFIQLRNSRWTLEQSAENVMLMDAIVTSAPNFVQELIYNGRSGDSLKFIYRELTDNLLRAAFTQEVQYDLSQSKEIGFKDVRLEVIEASNTEIRYKLLNNF